MKEEKEKGVTVHFSSSKINTFKELFDHIEYDWSYDPKNLIKDGDLFVINKTTISREWLQYKTEVHEMAPGLYDKLQVFYDLLED